MVRLHGVSISNYYSTVKVALLEKNVPFEEIATFPSQKPEVLAVSHMGKIPWIELDGKVLTETNVIFDYLEDVSPDQVLYPTDPWDRAKVKELIRIVELYIDSPARRHIASVYFGEKIDQAANSEVLPAVKNGLRALKKVCRLTPYLAGNDFTYADISAYFQLRFANLHMKTIYGWDFISEWGALERYLEFVAGRPSISSVDTVMQRDLAAFLPK